VKLPKQIDSITLDPPYETLYPPLGFHGFQENALGNGDCFGLYWPIGREDEEPIIAETVHDEGSIAPRYSTLGRFLKATGGDDAEYVETPSYEDDPDSPAACLERARGQLKADEVDAAIQTLEKAVGILPEYAEAHALLCAQYRRLGRADAAIRAAIRTLISPPCFGHQAPQVAGWLAKQTRCPADIETDPIWINRAKLNFKFGGEKTNNHYLILRSAIDSYFASKNWLAAMSLIQCYGEWMSGETVSFQERYEFNPPAFRRWQRDVAATQYGKSRGLSMPLE
jgi:tetratricopeptide (TPR) repeat protein